MLSPGQFGRFSGVKQGVRYRGNGGVGALVLSGHDPDLGQQALFSPREEYEAATARHPESVEWGHTATQRRHDPTQWNGQLPLPGMPTPTDPHVERLRQANPHLSDFTFTVKQRERRGQLESPHELEAHDRAGNRVGWLKLRYERERWEEHAGHREVDAIGVAPVHAGKGLGEALYDLARMKGARIVHSDERSESGEAFARRVGGPALQRRRGIGQDDYLGHNPDPERV